MFTSIYTQGCSVHSIAIMISQSLHVIGLIPQSSHGLSQKYMSESESSLSYKIIYIYWTILFVVILLTFVRSSCMCLCILIWRSGRDIKCGSLPKTVVLGQILWPTTIPCVRIEVGGESPNNITIIDAYGGGGETYFYELLLALYFFKKN